MFKKLIPLIFLIGFAAKSAETEAPQLATKVLLIIGAPGEEKYEEGFKSAANTWMKLCEQGDANLLAVGLESRANTDREQIQSWLSMQAAQTSRSVWIVYIGHGTSNQLSTKLNLRGPDLELADLKNWIEPIQSQLVVIHGGSASASFIPELSAPNRIIITATKSSQEINYARFGEIFAQALASPRGDLDQDGQVSLLEAFVSASQTVDTFYLESGRLATEHALLDDNGDGKGLPAESFHGLRVKGANAVDDRRHDGRLARNLALVPAATLILSTSEDISKRDELERQVEELIRRKGSLPESQYYDELESLFRELANIYLPES